MEKKKKLTGQQGELMRVLDISVDDLIANDDGYISQAQQTSVLKRQSYQWKIFKVMTGIFSLMSMFFAAVALTNFEESGDLLGMTILFLLLASVFGVIGLVQRYNIKRELGKNRLETTQGIAVVNLGAKDERSFLEINGMKLKASPDVLRRVQHLQPYLIHYLPNSKVILSMENIPDESNLREDVAQSRLQDQVHSAATDYDAEVSKKRDSL